MHPVVLQTHSAKPGRFIASDVSSKCTSVQLNIFPESTRSKGLSLSLPLQCIRVTFFLMVVSQGHLVFQTRNAPQVDVIADCPGHGRITEL
jgi:hypothetical protein